MTGRGTMRHAERFRLRGRIQGWRDGWAWHAIALPMVSVYEGDFKAADRSLMGRGTFRDADGNVLRGRVQGSAKWMGAARTPRQWWRLRGRVQGRQVRGLYEGDFKANEWEGRGTLR